MHIVLLIEMCVGVSLVMSDGEEVCKGSILGLM